MKSVEKRIFVYFIIIFASENDSDARIGGVSACSGPARGGAGCGACGGSAGWVENIADMV